VLVEIILRLQKTPEQSIPKLVNEVLIGEYQKLSEDIEKIKNSNLSWERKRLNILGKYATYLRYSLKENTCKYLSNIY